MKSIMTVCAQGTSIDRYTNQLSLFNVIEDIGAAAFPLWFPHAVLVNVVERRGDEAERVPGQVIVRQGENVLMREAIEVEFEGKLRARSLMVFNGIPIPAPGVLKFEVALPGDEQPKVFEVNVTRLAPDQIPPAFQQNVVPVPLQVPAPAAPAEPAAP